MNELRRAIDENELLRERIRQLEEIIAPQVEIPPSFRLTPTESRIFRSLKTGRVMSRNSLLTLLYSDRAEPPENELIVNSFICHIRRKIEPFGLKIECSYGVGWWLVEPEFVR